MSEWNGDRNGQERRGCRGCYVNGCLDFLILGPFIHRLFFACLFWPCLPWSVYAALMLFSYWIGFINWRSSISVTAACQLMYIRVFQCSYQSTLDVHVIRFCVSIIFCVHIRMCGFSLLSVPLYPPSSRAPIQSVEGGERIQPHGSPHGPFPFGPCPWRKRVRGAPPTRLALVMGVWLKEFCSLLSLSQQSVFFLGS